MGIGEILEFVAQFVGLVALLGFLVVAVPRLWTMFRSADPDETYAPPTCPDCGYDLRATPRECPECGAIVADRRRYLRSLANDWPADAIEVKRTTPQDVMVELMSTDNQTEAELLEQQLNARGVRCVVSQRRSTQKDVYRVAQVLYFQVCVPSADERLAREYLCRAQGIPADLVEPALSGQRKVVVV